MARVRLWSWLCNRSVCGRELMKEKSTTEIKCILLLVSFFLLCACGKKEEEPKVKVLIVPKFEIGEMSGDEASEAQLFYEHYCAGCFSLLKH